MKKPLLLVTLIYAFTFYTNGQINQNLRELLADAEYFFLSEDYEEALYSYNIIFSQGNANNSNINYRIGLCYLNIPGQKQKAIPFLRRAVLHMTSKYSEGNFRETQAPYSAQFFLGNAYRIACNLDSAIFAYEKYRNLIDIKKDKLALKLVNKEIQACRFATELMKKPVSVKMTLLPKPVNTSSKDYSPAVSGDEQRLVYNSSQKFYQAVLFCKKVQGKWENPINITPQVESDGNQFVSSLSYDGNNLFLREEDNFQSNLYLSEYKDGKWTKSEPLNKNINTKYWEGNASISSDGNTLYFSSNRIGGTGALDLYKSVKRPDGEWGPAINLGKVVNTEFNEDAPFVTEDGKRLYFISQGHQTMGGYDIFYSDIKADGSFGEPVNLGFPINSTDDDMYFVPVNNGRSAYMALFSPDGYGKQDLFRVEIASDRIKLPPLTDIPVKSDSLITKQQPEMNERILPKETGTDQRLADLNVTKAIFFGFNSAVLSEKAKKQLDHMVVIHKNIPDLMIELVGNTDSKGPDAYNLRLSRQRAIVARNYLISKGIEPGHINVKGMGEKNCIAINTNPDGSDNPAGRVYNRRVEINLSGMGLSSVEEVKAFEDFKIPDNLKVTQ